MSRSGPVSDCWSTSGAPREQRAVKEKAGGAGRGLGGQTSSWGVAIWLGTCTLAGTHRGESCRQGTRGPGNQARVSEDPDCRNATPRTTTGSREVAAFNCPWRLCFPLRWRFGCSPRAPPAPLAEDSPGAQEPRPRPFLSR